MCGITGWANLDSSTPLNNNDEAVLHSMCEAIVHRGPDSEGLWTGDGVALGMRRLSIIDLHTGDQPVFNTDRSVIVMMNGELYNYREVRADLQKRGYTFRTNSDTEILPHLYDEYGDAMLEHVSGMFAFALWDTKRKRLLIARDRFGEKPLYYGTFGRKLIYGSEVKTLLAHPDVKTDLNLDALRQYLSFDYVPAPHSIYQGINKLPAAHKLVLENGAVKIDRYWSLSFEKPIEKPSVAEAAEHLRELLSDAVRRQLVSDVPLGILLSGGVDSSTIAAFAVRHATETVKTFSIGFTEDSFDESKYAREVSRHLGTEHYEDILSVDTAASLIGDIGKWLDEPLSDGSLLPTYLLASFVRKHVTVALGGDGGDEIFAGYPMYYAHKIAGMYERVPGVLRKGLIEPAVNAMPVSAKNMSLDYKAKRFIRAANYDPVTRHHSWFGSFAIDQHNSLLTREVLAHTSADIYRDAKDLLKTTDAKSRIEQMQFLDINFYMAEDILTKVDRAAMAVSLETRAPFLDPRVAEYAASLPPEYKLRGNKGKFILKEAVKDMLPASILNRPKKGFGIPIAQWLRGNLNPLMHDMLAADRLKQQGIFDAAYVQKLITEHETSKASHHKELWTLLVFQLWYQNFLSQS